ncbi:3229_t:CDS:2, partial [Cetraspora pellucida]
MHVNTTGLSFNDTAQDSTFRMVAFDAEKDLFYSNSSSPFEESLFYLNKYLLARNSQYILLYNRKILKAIDKRQKVLSIIGFPTKHEAPLNYIESYIDSFPMTLNSSVQPYCVVRVNPRDFFIVEEEEQRHSTVRVDSIQPWGVVHNCCGIKEKTQKKLLREVHSINTDDLESLIQRVNDIENFHHYLRHSVIDSSLFVSIQQEQQDMRK